MSDAKSAFKTEDHKSISLSDDKVSKVSKASKAPKSPKGAPKGKIEEYDTALKKANDTLAELLEIGKLKSQYSIH